MDAHHHPLPVEERKPEPLRRASIDELAKAITKGRGNRKERRRAQADIKKLMRRKA